MNARLTAASRREQLLLIARALFARLGYDATSTALIASTAGVSERLLYKHFTGKKDIFLNVVATVANGVVALYQEMAAADLTVQDGVSRLYAVRFMGPNAPGSSQPLFFGRSYGPFEDNEMDAALGHAYREMAEAGTAYFESLARRGLLREAVIPAAAAWMLASLFREHESLRLAYPPKQVTEIDYCLMQQFVQMIARQPDPVEHPRRERSKDEK